jgi:hypothetical protein
MIVANGANITKKAAETISQAALDYANKAGYCEVVEEFLTELGFPIPTNEVTVTITAKVRAPRGADQWDVQAALRELDINQHYDDYEVLSSEVKVG